MKKQANGLGTLYVVATPIGHLSDLSPRAVQTLNEVAWIAAEDTRHSQRLKKMHAIDTPMVALHQHNEAAAIARVAAALQAGESVGLISDAGTPLISDPGQQLVQALRSQGLPVSPIPGPCALVAALSVAGLPTDRFVFEGFLPAKAGARRTLLQTLATEMRTMVFYEAPHRLLLSLQAMVGVFGADRRVVLAAELTKMHEKILSFALADAVAFWAHGDAAPKGEWVVLVAGCKGPARDDGELDRMLRCLLTECSLKQAVAVATRCLDLPKNHVYERALALSNDAQSAP